MRLVFLIGLFCISSSIPARSASADSLSVFSSVDSLEKNTLSSPIIQKKKRIYNPDRAALLAAVVPGLGQIYNRKYWKLPLVYGGVVGFYYWISYNHKFYIQFRDLYLEGLLSSKNLQNLDPVTARAKDLQNFYRRTRDLAIILSGVFYLLTIVDAYADAHFRSFDITEDLSLHINPSIQPTLFPNQWGSGLTFSLRFK
jgi:hypothetical protein